MSEIFSVVVHKEKKYYVAECPEFSTVSQGKTIEKAIENLKKATELYLEKFPQKKTSKPFVSFFEVTAYGKAQDGPGMNSLKFLLSLVLRGVDRKVAMYC